MKLFIIATLVAVGSAARLDHLERSYLPPQGNQGLGAQGPNSFGSQNGPNFGDQQSQRPEFGGQGPAFGGQSGFPSNAATSNQYLPPNQGSQFGNAQGPQRYQNAPQQFGQTPGSQYGAPQSNFGGQGGPGAQGGQAPNSQYSSPQSNFGGQAQAPGAQYGAPQSNFGQSGAQFGGQGAPGAQGAQGAQYNPQFPSASNQYLPPQNQNNFQNIPQQSFDEQTGYHY